MTYSDKLYSPYKQLILLFISILLFVLYYNQVFKNDDYNKLCLIYGIFILLWDLTVVLRYIYLYYYPNLQITKPLIEMPYDMKCYIGEPRCETGDFTIFTIIHLISYTIIGYFVPGYYFLIFIISIICEVFELGIGFQSKFILDPIVNMTGYIIGSQINYATK